MPHSILPLLAYNEQAATLDGNNGPQENQRLPLFNELKRRNVFKVTVAYIIVAWLLLQVSDTLVPALQLPEWFHSGVAVLLILGLPVAIIFAWAFEMTPEGLKREYEVDRSQSITAQTGRKLEFMIIGALIIALGYFAYDKFVFTAAREAELVEATTQAVTELAAAEAQASAETDKSIAVLPFVNMSSDPDQEYFSDGISEELLNVLAQFPGLRVAARTSSFQFKGQNQDIADIARQLHVNHVVEGSVRKSGNRLRITAQLIDAGSGFHLWSESWDRELNDIFVIQDEISAAIGDALKIELQLGSGNSPGALPSIPAAATAQAYEYYLKGRQLINERSRHGLEEAVKALELALEIDERYAPAHAQLAIAIALQKGSGSSYGNLSMKAVLARAVPHLDRAFELSPNLAEAFGAKTLLATLDNAYLTVLKNSEKALVLNPSYVDVINWRYLAFMNTGQWVEAMETMDYMMAVDPLSIIGRINYALALARTARIEQARQTADDLARQTSHGSFTVHALIAGDYLGELTDSNQWYLKSLALDPGNVFTRHRLAINFAAIREFDEARHLAPESHWWVNAIQQRWSVSIAQARQRLVDNLRNNQARMDLANVLHMSGDLAAAQVIYEELQAITSGYALLDASNTSIMPTARMAYGRLAAGDTTGTEEILELLKKDIRSREQAGIRESYMLRAAAMVAAIEGDREQVMANLEAAIGAGLRDNFILREPAMEPYQEDPEFQALVARLDAILEEEHHKTLQLICFNNPASEVWQPLPASCEDVEDAG